VLYAANATVMMGGWKVEADASAANNSKLRHPDAQAAKLSAALANPTHYFELTFNAEAGRPYHLWLRGRADTTPSPAYYNDSVFVQFSDSVTNTGAATWQIGTTDYPWANDRIHRFVLDRMAAHTAACRRSRAL
jgi:hypothetical protein